MFRNLIARLTARATTTAPGADPYDHPELRRMSPAERADLPSHHWQDPLDLSALPGEPCA